MSENTSWKFLVRKPKSSYQQLFVRDRWVAARTLFGQTLGEDARSPEQVAADYELPLEAVHEAILYCASNPPEIHADWLREEESIRASGRTDPKANASGDSGIGASFDRAPVGQS